MRENIILNTVSIVTHFGWRDLVREKGYSEGTLTQLYEKLFLNDAWNEWTQGLISDEQLVERMNSEYTGSGAQVTRFLKYRHKIEEQAIEFGQWISLLNQKGYKIYTISSYPMSTLLFDVRNKSMEAPQICGQIILKYIDMSKPDTGSYRRLMNMYGLQAKECVFIDDNLDNIESIKALGIEGIVFKDYDQTTQEIDAFMKKV